MIRYLTGCHNEAVAAIAHARNVGLLIQPGNRYHRQVHRYPAWAGDNGAFTKAAGGFSAEKFREMLRRPELAKARATCLFVVAPDCLQVLADGTVIGDAAGTLAQFPAWAEEIRAAGFPVAYVAQPGTENMLNELPWDLIDVVFLGGDDEWKESAAARRVVFAAQHMGRRTHMGRVNSGRRLALAETWGVDTADGRFLQFGKPHAMRTRMLRWRGKLPAKLPRYGLVAGPPEAFEPKPEHPLADWGFHRLGQPLNRRTEAELAASRCQARAQMKAA